MHTMRLTDAKAWSVGYWYQLVPVGKAWEEICQFSDTVDAVNRVNALNGGPGIVDGSGVQVLFKMGETQR